MATFVCERIGEVVWHPVKQRRVAKFENGRLETDDAEVIQHLIERGYQQVEDEQPEAVAELEPVERPEVTEKPAPTARRGRKPKAD